MNRQKVSPYLQSRVSVGEEGAGRDSAWPGWIWPCAEGGKLWQLCEVAHQLVQKGFEQQAVTPIIVSALPKPENRLKEKGKKRAYILFLKMWSKEHEYRRAAGEKACGLPLSSVKI